MNTASSPPPDPPYNHKDGGYYAIAPGDCVSSIAVNEGRFWDNIWNHANNSDLRQRCKDPNTLIPGDYLYIPPFQLGEDSVSSDAKYRYKRKGVPSKLVLCILQGGEPRKNERYSLEIDGRTSTGNLDGDGKLTITIPGNAQDCTLVVGDDAQTFYFLLGSLPPLDTISGIKARLNNLGYACGAIDDTLTPAFRDALLAFQNENNLNESGENDASTKEAIRKAHGS